MGTSNFHSVSGKYYAVLMPYTYEDDETGEKVDYIPDEHDSEMLIEYVKEKLLDTSKYAFWDEHGRDSNELRSYGSKVIGTLGITKMFGDVEVEVNALIVMRYGYYEGANLDYTILYGDGGELYDDTPDSYEGFTWYSEMPLGMMKIQSKNADKWLKKTAEELESFVNEVLSEVSEPLRVAAQFSNGETWYEKETQ